MTTAKGGADNSVMVRLISDLVPALVFFISYNWTNKHGVPEWGQAISGSKPILFATLVFLPAALLGMVFAYWKERSISPMGLFMFVMVGIFSGLALWLKNDLFIKMRPTLIYAMMGCLLLVSVAFKRNVLKSLFSGALHMAEVHWHGLAQRAGLMYLSLAALNEIVWRSQTEANWVTYNTWGDATINLLFWIVNLAMLAKHMTDADGQPLIEDKA